MNFLSGYKTYIAAVAIGVATALKVLGIIDESTFESIVGALTALGLVAARIGTVKDK